MDFLSLTSSLDRLISAVQLNSGPADEQRDKGGKWTAGSDSGSKLERGKETYKHLMAKDGKFWISPDGKQLHDANRQGHEGKARELLENAGEILPKQSASKDDLNAAMFKRGWSKVDATPSGKVISAEHPKGISDKQRSALQSVADDAKYDLKVGKGNDVIHAESPKSPEPDHAEDFNVESFGSIKPSKQEEIRKNFESKWSVDSKGKVSGDLKAHEMSKKIMLATWSSGGSGTLGFARNPGERTHDSISKQVNAAVKEKNPLKTKESATLILGIRDGTVKENLYRGMTVKPDDPILKLKQGQSMQIMPSSFSTDEDVANKFGGKKTRKNWESGVPKGQTHYSGIEINATGVHIHVSGGAHGMKVEGPGIMNKEKEVISGGKFEVVKVVNGELWNGVKSAGFNQIKSNDRVVKKPEYGSDGEVWTPHVDIYLKQTGVF